MANHSSLDIWNRIAPAGSFAMRMYLGNKHFRQCFRDTPTGHEFQIDVKHEIFQTFFFQIFCQFKENIYLCTRNREINNPRELKAKALT
jgi:hypothetical protein